MSRSGYTEDLDDGTLNLYRGTVYRCIKGKRGKAFLIELAAALDAMTEKELIAGVLVEDERMCALGALGIKRGLDLNKIDYENPRSVGKAFGIAWQLAAEIEFINDDDAYDYRHNETLAERWKRVRAWVQRKIDKPEFE